MKYWNSTRVCSVLLITVHVRNAAMKTRQTERYEDMYFDLFRFSNEGEIYVWRNGPHASRKSVSKVRLRASQVSLTTRANPKQRAWPVWIFLSTGIRATFTSEHERKEENGGKEEKRKTEKKRRKKSEIGGDEVSGLKFVTAELHVSVPRLRKFGEIPSNSPALFDC